jgi:hypothetical protein
MKAEEETRGGFHFGNIGRDVKLAAGGDIVAADKRTVTRSTTITKSGFESAGHKEEFERQLDALREGLELIRSKVEINAALSAEQKEDLTIALQGQAKALEEVAQTTTQVIPGQKTPAHVVELVKSTLEETGDILEKVETVGKKSADFVANVSALALKYGPLVLSARHLFGLP